MKKERNDVSEEEGEVAGTMKPITSTLI